MKDNTASSVVPAGHISATLDSAFRSAAVKLWPVSEEHVVENGALSSSGTLTRRVRDMIARLLHQGELGSPLPPERQLAHLFGVSRVTIRRALAMLAEDEMLSRQQGRGTYAVSGPPIYTPDQIAQMPGNVIAALTHETQSYFDPQASPYFWRTFQSLERYLAERKIRVIFASSADFLSWANRNRRKLPDGLKGFIAAGDGWYGDEFEQAYDCALPFVAIERVKPVFWNVIDMHFTRAIDDAVNDLRVGPGDQVLLSGPRFVSDWTLRPALLHGLDRRGVPASHIHYGQGGVFEGDGYLTMRRHLREAGGVPPNVVIAESDLVAAGVYRALSEAYPRKARLLKIGRDIRILGFGDYEISRHLEPQLSTIALDSDAMVRVIWEMLEQQLQTGQPAGMRRIDNATYVPRASTRSGNDA
jgi:DNA-binding LacI/PurR family transcriptional regulator